MLDTFRKMLHDPPNPPSPKIENLKRVIDEKQKHIQAIEQELQDARANLQVLNKQKEEWLPKIAGGEALIGVGISEYIGARENAGIEFSLAYCNIVLRSFLSCGVIYASAGPPMP